MKRYKFFLDSEGIQYDDSRGDVRFSYKGFVYIIGDNTDNDSHFWLMLPKIGNVSEFRADRLTVLELINKFNEMIVGITVVLIEDEVWISSKMFISSAAELKEIFYKLLDLLDFSAQHFHSEMRKKIFGNF